MKRRDIFDWLAFMGAKLKLRKSFGFKTFKELYDFTVNYTGHGYYDRISMSQKYNEIRQLAEAVKSTNPKTIVEIGTRKGGTLFTWARFTDADLIISLDLEGGIHGGGYHPKKQKLYKSFVSDRRGAKILLIQADSHLISTFDNLKSILGDRKVDFLFIDGDHTYEGVKNDFEMYGTLVRSAGLIAFHDIVPNTTDHPDASTIEVPKFWNEIKGKYQFWEFIEPSGNSWMGVGLLKTN